MNVDRSRFLLLAAALSANACTINNNTTTAPAGGDSSPADSSAGGDGTVDTGGDDSADGATDDAAMEVAVDGADASDASEAADASDASDALCTDEGAAVVACMGAVDGGCSFDTLPQCASYAKYFKPRLGKLAIDCLTKLPTCEGSADVYICGYSALESACPDATLDAYCASLIAICSDAGADASSETGADSGSSADLDDCKKYAGGLNADGRARLQTVVTEGGCTTPLKDHLVNL